MQNALSVFLAGKILLFCPTLCRVSAMLIITPVFGNSQIPVQIKIAATFLISVILYPILAQSITVPVTDAVAFFMLALREIIAGLILGFASTLVFSAVQLGGEIIGRDMGLGLAQVFDPTTDEEISIISQFQYILAILIFLSINGHHWLLMAIGSSFDLIPIGTVTLDPAIIEKLLAMMGAVFTLAVKIVAPAFAVLLLSEISIGLVSRAVPEMNVFVVAMPLKIGIGLLGLALSLPMFSAVFGKFLNGMCSDVSYLIQAMR